MLLPFVRELFADVEQLPSFTRAASHLRESAGRIRVTGLSPSAKTLIIVLLRRAVERPFVLVVADNRVAEDLLPVLRAFCEMTQAADPESVVNLPARDVLAVPEFVSASGDSGRARDCLVEDRYRASIDCDRAGFGDNNSVAFG